MPKETIMNNNRKKSKNLLFKECQEYNIPLWQCPSFLFFLMGVFIMAAIIGTYFIAAAKIGDPQLVVLMVLIVAAVLLIISQIITNSFERVSQANRMKTEFINIVSHQLRSPLTNLRYSLEVLNNERNGKSGKEKEYFQILEENFQRMGVLINNLLLVSRLEMGKIPIKKEEIFFEDAVKKVILKSKGYAESSDVKVILRSEKNLPNVFVDSFWIEQIIQNLLDNAIRYTKRGGEIEIKIRNQMNKIIFSIRDSGVGIPKEEQKYIFQKFFRSKNAIKFQTQGSGLGLFIVKEILEMMDGKIWFESEENKGTTFFFILPALKIKTKV